MNKLNPILVCCVLLSACSNTSDAGKLRGVSLELENELACLSAPVEVIFTEAGHPHIYGENENDVACALGFVVARDRYFEMEMAARLALGRLSEIFGEFALATDIENRTLGMREAAERQLEGASPEWRAKLDAYAAGVNEYVKRVRSGQLPPPSEFEFDLLRGLGAFDSAADMMDDFDALKAAAVGVIVVYEAGFGTGELGFEAGMQQAEEWGLDLPFPELRRDGLYGDVIASVQPIYEINSSPDFAASQKNQARVRPGVEANTLARAIQRGESWQARHKRPANEPGIGSNGWAVGPQLTADGQTLLAGDGHLSLTVPSFFYLAHVDTAVLGDGNLHYIGLSLPGVPLMGPGTNGKIAWTQTVLNGDPLDWYAEEVVLDESGKPTALMFQGTEQPLSVISETYVLPGGGEQSIARYQTQAGRLLYSLEGTTVDDAASDPAAVNVNGEWLVAGDVDSDGIVSGISLVYGSQFEKHLFDQVGEFAYAGTVQEIAELFKNVVSYSAILTVADAEGGVMSNGYVAAPCRSYLPSDDEGRPLPGADPQRLIDGTKYPSWHVRLNEDGSIDHAPDDERACVLPFADYPHAINPQQGYVLNANNEIHNNTFDGNLWNDTYLGGPYAVGFRAKRIDDLIQDGSGTHDVESMVAMQADHHSNTAALFLDDFLAAVERVGSLPASVTGSEARQRVTQQENKARIGDAIERLIAWQARGLNAASGVHTFYETPSENDRLDAIATSIWNAWQIQVVNGLFADEAIPSGAYPGSSRSRQLKLMRDFLDGAGAGNPLDLASWNPDTGEPVFWDDARTSELELRDEIIISGLVRGLDFLASEPGADMRSGGFGSSSPDDWLWGLKHFVRLESILTLAVGSELSGIFESFGITTENLPLTDSVEGLATRLKGFPRPGDMFNVDAANFGFGEDFSYGSGAVMRMVISMGTNGVSGYNVVPGGQSGLNDSPHFADQAALWLGNEALPIHFTVDEVVDNAVYRERLFVSE